MSGPVTLVLSQVYPPDPASVGQHLHDVARELARRGRAVRVVTADRGYDDPSVRYPRREVRDGVEIRRVRWSSFGKGSIPVRAAAMAAFLVHCTWAALTTPRLEAILVSTSPPLCGLAAAVGRMLRRVRMTYWVMDLNPDQMIELGHLRRGSPTARFIDAIQRFVMGRADAVVALDRFMAARLLAKLPEERRPDLERRMTVMPPWPHDEGLEDVPHASNPFRERHGLNDAFVVMYSGNHGYSTPVDLILQAALRMDASGDPRDERVRFVFVGGGVRKKEVDRVIAEHRPRNVASLPYQPFSELKWSLSAADVHLVTVGDDVVGVVHPCKIYGAMAVARPILLVAPDPCHASDIVADNLAGWHVPHGDVDRAVETIRGIAATPAGELAAMGARARAFIDGSMRSDVLCGRFCDIVEGKPRA